MASGKPLPGLPSFPLPPHRTPPSRATTPIPASPSLAPPTPTSANDTATTPPIPPLGPLAQLPLSATGLAGWKVLLLVTAVNSFSQRVITYLHHLEFNHVSVQIAASDDAMQKACEGWNPDLVICPFLTRRIPDTVFNKWITLVVHPGPPGDAGPSSLDWVLLGDDGSISDSTEALSHLLTTSHETWSTRQRSHWGTIVFQANEHLDGGSVWAWEQYPLPSPGTTTKAQLYQNQHSIAAMSALIHAMIRVYETAAGLDVGHRMYARPMMDWQNNSVTLGVPFLGGPTHERPLLQSKARKPIWNIHTAEDVLRILYASDSQPGAQLAPLTTDSKTSLFAYGAHVHDAVNTIPTTLYTSIGYGVWGDIPDGTILATRSGAVLIKTRPLASGGPVALWITHGRIPKRSGSPLEPKIPIAEAIIASGHGKVLQNVQEWELDSFDERQGVWQEVFVRTLVEDGKLAQCVYWDFYNGAFSTEQCQLLLRALQWATAPARGNVKLLALMGGAYFSNGIALNTIESSSNPGKETWANINAIDDIVEFLVSDVHSERSAFMEGVEPLCTRGIVTVACLRSNAAAGGVALAAGCDVTIAGRGVVLNPAYRAMGLHGSEFHSYSYLNRCGPNFGAAMLRDMLPQSSRDSYRIGLVDIEVGTATSTRPEIEALCIDQLRSLLVAPSSLSIRCAPWSTPSSRNNGADSLVDTMALIKRQNYLNRSFPPLVHFRNEELSQMLLDSFHPVRSNRYHERRYKFIRKVKSDATPARYMKHMTSYHPDPEDLPSFDDAPGWIRGEEWFWAGLHAPKSLTSSEHLRIKLYPTATSPMIKHVEEDLSVSQLPPRMDSAVSVSSEFSTPDPGNILQGSTESSPLPMTPPYIATRNRSSGFKKPTNNVSSPLVVSHPEPVPAVPSTRPNAPPPPPSTPTSPHKFKNFRKKLSTAFGGGPRKSPPASPTRENNMSPSPTRFGSISSRTNSPHPSFVGGVQGKIISPPIPMAVPPSPELTATRSVPVPIEPSMTTTAKDYTNGNGNSNTNSASDMAYTRPNVPNADQVDFPCLYDREVKDFLELANQEVVGDLNRYVEPRKAPVPPTAF